MKIKVTYDYYNIMSYIFYSFNIVKMYFNPITNSMNHRLMTPGLKNCHTRRNLFLNWIIFHC